MSRQSAKTLVDYLPVVADEPSMPLADLFSIEPDESVRAARASGTNEQAGVVIGAVVGVNESGQPVVDFVGNTAETPLAARSTVPFSAQDIGRDAVLIFVGGDLEQPIIVGLLQPSQPAPSPGSDEGVEESSAELDAMIDGERIVLSAEKEIVLRCGKASITLTRAGKVLIRGAYLLSRSSGVNRVKGGSVQIN